MTLTGPDVSHHQGDVNMRAVHDDGHHTFVGIKVSEGASYIDPQFRRNRDHARDVGLIRLLYHFGRPGKNVSEADARSEAAYFCGAIGQLEAGEIAVLDIEDSAVAAGVNLGPWSLAFLDEVDRRTGRAASSADDGAELYTYGPYATAHLRLSKPLGDRHLWLAAYSTSPNVPSPWKSWTFWQWTSNGTCPGIAGRCDLNRFTGPIEALQRLAGITPTSQEDDVFAYKVVEIPLADDQGRQLAGREVADRGGQLLGKWHEDVVATIKANDDGRPVKATVQVCKNWNSDDLILSFTGLDGGPAPTGNVGVVIGHPRR